MKLYQLAFTLKLIAFTLGLNGSQKSTVQDLNLLIQEQTINLVILNDSIERFSPQENLENLSTQSRPLIGNLVKTLLDNHLCLCRKELWLSLQNINELWNNYRNKTIEEIAKIYPEHNIQDIPLYKSLFEELDKIYSQRESIITTSFTLDKNKTSPLQKGDFVFEKLNDKYSFIHKTQLLSAKCLCIIYFSYKIILARNYLCKELSDDFLLFIPEHLTSQFNSSETSMYDYKKTNPKSVDILKTFPDLKITSESLLNALQKFALNITAKDSIFFNIFLAGHGYHNIIAEISTKIEAINPESNFKTSYFLKVLDFFNYQIHTNSLALQSCYPGGKKIVQTFNLSNQFNNVNMEKINYPIIFIGSFFTPIYSYGFTIPEDLNSNQYLFGLNKSNNITEYFTLVNKKPSNYTAINQLFLNDENRSKLTNLFLGENRVLHNYVSIKFPHTSWLRPTDTQNTVFNLTQIKALNNAKILINSFITDVLMTANNINTVEIYNYFDNLPNFLPFNQINQNYLFNEVIIHDWWLIKAYRFFLSKTTSTTMLQRIMKSFLPLSEIEEPIRIVIKKLTFYGKSYSNVLAFTYIKAQDLQKEKPALSEDTFLSGYIYTDDNDETKIVSWNTESKYPEELKAIPFPLEKLQELISNVELKATDGMKVFENIESMLHDMKNKPTPKIIQESRNDYEIAQKTGKIIDLVKALA